MGGKVVCNLHTKVVEKWQTAKSFPHFLLPTPSKSFLELSQFLTFSFMTGRFLTWRSQWFSLVK